MLAVCWRLLAFAGAMPRASAKTEILKWLRTRLKTVLGVIGYKQSSPAIEARVDFAIRAELRRASKEELAAMPLVCPAWLTDAALQTAYLNVDGLPIIADGDRAAVVADAAAAAIRRPCAFAAAPSPCAAAAAAPQTPLVSVAAPTAPRSPCAAAAAAPQTPLVRVAGPSSPCAAAAAPSTPRATAAGVAQPTSPETPKPVAADAERRVKIDRFGRPFGIYRERAIVLLCKEMRTSLVKVATSMKQLRPLKLKNVSVEAKRKERLGNVPKRLR